MLAKTLGSRVRGESALKRLAIGAHSRSSDASCKASLSHLSIFTFVDSSRSESLLLLKRAARIPPCQNVLRKLAFSLGCSVYWLVCLLACGLVFLC